MNMGALLRAKQAWETFSANHPSFPGFLNAVKQKGICEGAMVDIRIRYPDGSDIKSGICVKQSDLELLNLLKDLNNG